ncbi:MAG: glycosyltransferase [Gammaproteobacteria bacterium]|nr:glycosyltransferase [Gammaproteobacteria bacterium]
MKFFTICAENYFGQALTTLNSLKRHCGQSASIDLWVLDDSKPLENNNSFNIINCQEILQDFSTLSLRYNVLELSTAIKPYAFLEYFKSEKDDEIIVYIDPDLYFLSDICEIIKLSLVNNDYALTPHIKSPLPRDGKFPSDKEILSSGTYNLGFIAQKNNGNSKQLTKWWADWLETECWSDPKRGVFTDQKWINLATTIWQKFYVINHDGLNVAYWNIHENNISKKENIYFSNNEHLVFFHFSGFVPSELRLSKHENRIGVIPDSMDLRQLAIEYRNDLYNNDYSYYSKQPLKYLRTPTGGDVDKVYIFAFTEFEKLKLSHDFYWTWLAEKDSEGLTNYEKSFLIMRPDVKEAFIERPDFVDVFRNWLQNDGLAQEGLSEDIFRHIGLFNKIEITYAGYLSASSGVGDASRYNIKALQDSGVVVNCVDLTNTTLLDKVSKQDEDVQLSVAFNNKISKITIIHVNADSLPPIKKFRPDLFSNYVIGYWAWELEQFPSYWFDRDKLVDEIWVPSTFVKKSINLLFKNKTISVIPHTINIEIKNLVNRESLFDALNIPKRFTFLISFDACSCIERKNPEGAIEAFLATFRSSDEAQLIVKISNHNKCDIDKINDLRSKYINNKNVLFFTTMLSANEYMSLINAVDAYVSLHRSEGFGLNIAQAMFLCKPVVVTAYGGNMEFCNLDNSYLVPYTTTKISESWNDYRKGFIWAEPDIKSAASLLRHIYTTRDDARLKGINASNYIKEHLNNESVAAAMLSRFYSINRIFDAFPNAVGTDIKAIDDSYSVINTCYKILLDRDADSTAIETYSRIIEDYGKGRFIRDLFVSREFCDKHQINYISRFLLKNLWTNK